MDLSPEDRQRIYLEEKARLEARKSLKATAKGRKSGFRLPIIVSVVAVVALVLMANLWESPRKSYTVAVDRYCGDQGSVASAVIASADGDVAGLAGLMARGKLLPIKAGTRVSSGGLQDSGLTFVAIESGVSIGESCWVPTRVLQ